MRILFITKTVKEENGVGSARSRMLLNMLRKLYNNITVISDGNFSAKKIWFETFIGNYDIVYFSGPPFTIYLISLFLGIVFTNKKLIVDFRDPWSLNIKAGYSNNNNVNLIKLKIAESIEKLIYFRCNHFIVCTRGMLTGYQNLFSCNSKLRLIFNGHELKVSDIYLKKNKIDSCIEMVCCGKFCDYGLRYYYMLLEKLRKEKIKIRITFVGTDNKTKKIFQGFVLDNIKIEFEDRLPYDMVIKKIQNSDVGLLSIRNEDFDYGTKIYDYIGLGIPVYCLFDKTKEFYKTFQNYIIDDIVTVSESEFKPDYKMRFSRKHQIEKIIDLFKEESL